MPGLPASGLNRLLGGFLAVVGSAERGHVVLMIGAAERMGNDVVRLVGGLAADPALPAVAVQDSQAARAGRGGGQLTARVVALEHGELVVFAAPALRDRLGASGAGACFRSTGHRNNPRMLAGMDEGTDEHSAGDIARATIVHLHKQGRDDELARYALDLVAELEDAYRRLSAAEERLRETG